MSWVATGCPTAASSTTPRSPRTTSWPLPGAAGRTFAFRTPVTAVRSRGGRVSGVDLADGGSVDAPVVVNVAGPHSGAVNAMAGVLDDFCVSTRPLRQEVHHLVAPAGAADPLPFIADLDLGTYLRGTPGHGVLVGGTEPECDPLQWLDDPDDYVGHVTEPVHRAQAYRAARRLTDLTVPNTPRGVVGVYDVSDDWIPVYDRTALPGYYVAIGTSGNQFKNAPVVGLFMADLVEACEGGRDHDASPVQVPLPRTGHVADLGHYSRKRQVHAGSSFTVLG